VEAGAFGDGLTVYIKGYDTLMRSLKRLDANAYKQVRQTIKQQGNVVLNEAKSRANSFRDTGAFAGSLAIRDTQRGVKLVTTDEGGGTIEYANWGAVYLRGRFKGQPIGVPRGAAKPRAMIPAIVNNEQGTFVAVENALAILCDSVKGE